MEKQNTGLTLSQVKGPLSNLLDNLNGENGEYWLKALKKFLRKEEIPKPPIGAFILFKGLNSKEKAKEKINEWINFLNTIPSVDEASEPQESYGEFIDIRVSPNLNYFLNKNDNEDTALFSITTNGTIRSWKASGEKTDFIYDKWYKEIYKKEKSHCSIYSFYKALIKLGEMYENAIPDIKLIK
ncbi:MAG: hypothetical protein WCI41_02790 [bacterium]